MGILSDSGTRLVSVELGDEGHWERPKNQYMDVLVSIEYLAPCNLSDQESEEHRSGAERLASIKKMTAT